MEVNPSDSDWACRSEWGNETPHRVALQSGRPAQTKNVHSCYRLLCSKRQIPMYLFPCEGDTHVSPFLRQHRAIRQEPAARDFSSAERLENRGILGVFPVFQTARMGERPVIRPQTHLRGVALLYHGNPANSATRNCPSEKSGKLPLSARKRTVRFLFDGSKSAAGKKSGKFQKLSLTFPKDWV